MIHAYARDHFKSFDVVEGWFTGVARCSSRVNVRINYAECEAKKTKLIHCFTVTSTSCVGSGDNWLLAVKLFITVFTWNHTLIPDWSIEHFIFSTLIIYILHMYLAPPQTLFSFTLSAPSGGFVHIYVKSWTAFIISCCPPHLGWRHLRWSPRSPCRTCSSPGCCTCHCPTCSHRWWRSWRTCPTRTWGWCARLSWSPCRSSARWPLARGRPKCCRWDWEPVSVSTEGIGVKMTSRQQKVEMNLFTFPSCMVTTSGRPPATRARPGNKQMHKYSHQTGFWIINEAFSSDGF